MTRLTDEQIRELADEEYGNDEIEIDNHAAVSRNDEKRGAFVAAWVWVEFPEEVAA